jgi:hypothetical protein
MDRIQGYRAMRDQALAEAKERQLAEEALRQRLLLEEVVSGISTRFINVTLDQVDSEIYYALQEYACSPNPVW